MKKPSAATSRQSAVPSGWPQSAVRYAVAAADATSASLPWREEEPLFTNACEETVWGEISAANYATLTNKAVVKIVEREPLRLRASVRGVVLDGTGYGTATVKGVGSWPVTVE